MFRLDVLQNKYVIFSLGTAIAVLLLLLMFFLIMKRKRTAITYSEDKQSSAKQTIEYIPWLLILTWILIILYAVVATIYSYFYPPNW